MAIVNSNRVELLYLEGTGADGQTAPTANAANTTYKSLGSATTCSLDMTRENITITSKASNSFVERIPGVRDWTASVDGYSDYAQATQNIAGTSTPASDTANVPELFALMNAGTKIFIRFGIGDSRFLGGAYLTGVSQSGRNR